MSFDDVAIAARAAVALVFAASAVGKLHGVWLRRKEFSVFGGYAVVAVLTAVALPLVELAIAVLLVVVDAAWPTWLAVVAFAVFTGVLARRLTKGDLRPCNCFGQVSTGKALSTLSMYRNLWFLALAVVAAFADELADPVHGATTVVVAGALAGVSGLLIARS
jgi:hypothetical protein